jgi:HD-GYP domain-containing protein (c-di-GMP phosphodiesterase class II)
MAVETPASSGPGAAAGLFRLLDGKDPESPRHNAGIAALAMEVGTRLGLTGDRLADLRTASLLHDIGKIAVPDRILHKRGALDRQEMAVVHSHALVGSELMRSAGMHDAARIVLEHHERFDGSGYPMGLASDAIALEARILHAVDAYTAMRRDRPYRRAMSHELALTEIRLLTGTQFDAVVVRALEQVLEARAEPAPSWTVDTVIGRERRRTDTAG